MISPNRQRDGNGGILLPNILECFFMTSSRRELVGMSRLCESNRQCYLEYTVSKRLC